MPDEYVNVTYGGKTFDVRVPKGSDDNFIQQAAKDYHSARYPNEAAPTPKAEAFHQQTPVDLSKTPKGSPSYETNQQMIQSLGNKPEILGPDSAYGMMLGSAVEPLIAHGLKAVPSLVTGAGAGYLGDKLGRGVSSRFGASKDIQNLVGLGTGAISAIGGGLGAGKLGQVIGNLPEELIEGFSPNIRSALHIVKRAVTPNIDLPPQVEKFKGPADELASGINVPLRPPVRNLAAEQRAAGRTPLYAGKVPDIPGQVGQIEPSFQPAAPQQLPKSLPSGRLFPGQQPAPTSSFSEIPRTPNIINPRVPNETRVPADILKPNNPEPPVVKPVEKVENQGVPASTASFIESLPSSKALNIVSPKGAYIEPDFTVANPRTNLPKPLEETAPHKYPPGANYEPEAARAATLKEPTGKPREVRPEITESTGRKPIKPPLKVTHPDAKEVPEPKVEEKPHFTHKNISDIARYASGASKNEKISPNEVRRFIDENEMGTQEKARFPYKDREEAKTDRKATNNSPTIKSAIKYFFEHPEEFKP